MGLEGQSAKGVGLEVEAFGRFRTSLPAPPPPPPPAPRNLKP